MQQCHRDDSAAVLGGTVGQTWVKRGGVGGGRVHEKEYLEGRTIRALLLLHNEGVADTDVEPEVCSVEAQHRVIHICTHTQCCALMQ